jgi:hypothetical protein
MAHFVAKTICLVAVLISASAFSQERARFQSPLGFKLESATLSDVVSALGTAEEFEIPDSHHQFGVCYVVSDSSEIVVFATGREFGGPTKSLLGVTVHSENIESFPCSESALSSSDIDFGGLNLQISPQEFSALVAGEPDRLEGGYVDHDLEYLRPLTDEEREAFVRRSIDPNLIEGANVGLGIWARFVDGTAIEIGVWQITTF